MKDYTPANWYWIVGGSATQVYSSAIGDYVPATDQTYVAWQSDGTFATKIDTEANLGDVLAQISIRPTHAGILDAYRNSQANAMTVQLLAKWIFNHENRLRACERALALNGSPANVTIQQVITQLKSLI